MALKSARHNGPGESVPSHRRPERALAPRVGVPLSRPGWNPLTPQPGGRPRLISEAAPRSVYARARRKENCHPPPPSARDLGAEIKALFALGTLAFPLGLA